MTLTIKERLILGSVLPREGDITTLRIVRDLRAACSFSEEEHARLGIVTEGQQVRWNPDVPQETEVEVGPKAAAIIAEALKGLSDKKVLTEDFMSLWDRFCPEV
jgi:hypothetical protein